jgi:hypothetical protein
MTPRGGMVTSIGGEMPSEKGEGETMSVGPTRILLGQKLRKFTWSIQLLQIDGKDSNH